MKDEERSYRVITSAKAGQMIHTHTAFLARVSRKAARRLADDFLEAAHSLEVFPQRCPWFEGDSIPSHTYRYLVLEKRYLVIFVIVEDTVYIDYIVDCRQDYSWLLK